MGAMGGEIVSDLQYCGDSVDLRTGRCTHSEGAGYSGSSRQAEGDLYEEICMGDLYGRKRRAGHKYWSKQR